MYIAVTIIHATGAKVQLILQNFLLDQPLDTVNDGEAFAVIELRFHSINRVADLDFARRGGRLFLCQFLSLLSFSMMGAW